MTRTHANNNIHIRRITQYFFFIQFAVGSCGRRLPASLCIVGLTSIPNYHQRNDCQSGRNHHRRMSQFETVYIIATTIPLRCRIRGTLEKVWHNRIRNTENFPICFRHTIECNIARAKASMLMFFFIHLFLPGNDHTAVRQLRDSRLLHISRAVIKILP